MPERYLTVREAAARLRVHDRTVRAYLKDGRLTEYAIKTPKSRRIRIDAAEVEKLVSAQTPVVTGAGA